jgi:hypothetical protein
VAIIEDVGKGGMVAMRCVKYEAQD